MRTSFGIDNPRFDISVGFSSGDIRNLGLGNNTTQLQYRTHPLPAISLLQL